jgi:hypothetical protein
VQILATSSSPKEMSKNEQERKMGEMRRNLGIITVAK